MKISWLGHSSFLIETVYGTRIITDPFDPESVGYAAPKLDCDIVICSHSHSDHAYLKGVKNYSHAVTGAGVYQTDDVKISGTECNHDPAGGKLRGKNVINLIEADGITICHMGDIGEPYRDSLVRGLPHVNILMIPVGGYYTVDAHEAAEYVDRLAPEIVLPMHYRTTRTTLNIEPLDKFTALFPKDKVTVADSTVLTPILRDFPTGMIPNVIIPRRYGE